MLYFLLSDCDKMSTAHIRLMNTIYYFISVIQQTWTQPIKKPPPKRVEPDLPEPLPGRKVPVWKRKSVPPPLSPLFYSEQKRTPRNESLATFDSIPKPTRFEWPDEELPDVTAPFDDGISYSSRPLLTQEDEPRPSTSFDANKSRRTTNNYNSSGDDSQDSKCENDEIAEDGEVDTPSQKRRENSLGSVSVKRVRFNVNEKENQAKPVKYSVTPTGKTSSEMDHTKIISEVWTALIVIPTTCNKVYIYTFQVLKKYPHLVKKNKNIRLKILSKNNTSLESANRVLKQVPKVESVKVVTSIQRQPPSKSSIQANSNAKQENKKESIWKCTRCSTDQEPVQFALYYLYRKHMTDVHKEKFDSRMCR